MPDRSPTIVYTDGACMGNPGPGGWAWAVPGGRWATGCEAKSTNQRMEISAALEAVRAIAGPVEVVSDSTYVVNCFRDRWWEGWLARGWTNKAKKPVANRDLWEPFIDLYRSRRGEVHFTWVKGHSDDAMNDLVDRLAVEASQTQTPRSGDEPPTALGPADKPGRRTPPAAGFRPTGEDPRVPTGHLVAVSGHRPPELGGYEENPLAAEVRRKLVEVLDAKATMHPDLKVLTGLGLGAEQLAAEAAEIAGVPYVAVLPYPDPAKVWAAPSRDRFARLRDGAVAEIILSTAAPTSKQAAGGSLARRDGWLGRHADEAIVVWDGFDEFLGRLVRSWQDHLGEEQVWLLNPLV